jgi:hypothetical protein
MRLVTYADLPNGPRAEHEVSIAVRHVLEIAAGNEVLLLEHRGWGSSGNWAETTVESIKQNARTVVGPDEPPSGRTHEEETRLHWNHMHKTAEQHGIALDAYELSQLPHDVVLSPRLLAIVQGSRL